MRLKRPSVHVARGVTTPSRRRGVIVVTTQVARAIDRALSGEMVKTLTPAARGDGDGAPRHVKHAHKAKKPDALVLAFQQALLRNPAPGAFHPPPELAPAAAAGRNRRRAKMLMVRKKAKSYANAQGIKAVSTKRPLGVRKR